MAWRGVLAIAMLALAGSALGQDVQFASDFSRPDGPFARHAAAAEPFEVPTLPTGSSPDEVFDNPNWTAPIDRDVVEGEAEPKIVEEKKSSPKKGKKSGDEKEAA